MNTKTYLLGRDKRQSAVVIASFALLTLIIRAIAVVNPSLRFWPPEFLSAVSYIGFVPLVLLYGVIVALAYSNNGWLVSVGIAYCGTLMVPPGSHTLLPEPLFQQLMTEIWQALPLSLLWGTGAYLLGAGLSLLLAQVQGQNPDLSIN